MEEEPPYRRGRRRRRAARIVAAVLVLLLVALWFARVPLASRFVDRELAARGVPARYTVAGLGPRGQRLENVVLGDPARPDLVADWIETETGIGWSGPYLSGVRVGRVRIAARLVNGRVSLGSLDRLLPPPSGKPFALPALRVEGEDVRVRLETPAGLVGLRLAGEGRLDDGFRGTLAAVAPRLVAGGCRLDGVRSAVRLAIDDARPRLVGPLRLDRLSCSGARVAAIRADLDARGDDALALWRGRVRVATGAVTTADGGGRALTGEASGAIGANGGAGTVSLALAGATLPGVARAATLRVDGGYDLGPAREALIAEVRAEHLAVDPDRLSSLTGMAGALAGTPLAPLAARAVAAGGAAARDALVTGGIAVDGARGQATLTRLRVRSASGARLDQSDAALVYDWRTGIWPAKGGLTVEGGGLPALALSIARDGGGLSGRAVLRAPYAAGDARLALTPVRFRVDGRGASVTTVATLSGPVGDGRVDALRLPVRARFGGGAIALNPGCTPVAAAGLRVAGLALDRPRMTLCATGPALVRVAGGDVTGGARLPELRLSGSLGSSPVAIDGEGARIDLASRGFAIEGLRTRIGAPGRETRLNFASLDGRLAGNLVAGTFAGGAGRIGAVPLAFGEATGDWRFAGGALDVGGALVVTDIADAPRFQPMRGQDVRLRLAENAITAAGTLVESTTGTRVAVVSIAHALGPGVGHADLTVPGLTFRDGFQPELLTRVTFGVIADVRGTLAGDGRIAWGPDGVTSTGTFGTQALDLAAAFGPVTGLAGTIRFDDLLALRSAPDQVATVKEINPGIAVNDGTIRYQTLPNTQIRVEGGQWPFAGGTLTLEPTLLDFGQEVPRRMTFRVEGAAADKFLQQFAFDNLNATGTFDGVLPMVFDGLGGRIEGGRLKVRDGGGTIAYVGDLTEKELGFWGDFAFQALRSLRYRDLEVRMDGPLAGEMVTAVRFAGVSQGEGAKSNFLIRRLQRLPLVFNIRISAPFRGLIDSVQSFYDPSRLVGRNLPALLDAQTNAANKRVQPPASEKVP